MTVQKSILLLIKEMRKDRKEMREERMTDREERRQHHEELINEMKTGREEMKLDRGEMQKDREDRRKDREEMQKDREEMQKDREDRRKDREEMQKDREERRKDREQMQKDREDANKSREAFQKVIENDIKESQKIAKEIKESTKSFSKKMESYIGNDSLTIEAETNKFMRKYLKDFTTMNVFELQWKQLKKNKIEDVNNGDITEFDGLYFLSNDPEYYTEFSLYTNLSKETLETEKKTIIVVLEAKHMINTSIIDKKIEQMLLFQKYIEDAKTASDTQNVYTKEYLKKIKNYDLDKMNNDIFLVFASPHFIQDGIDHIKQNNEQWLKNHNIRVTFMVTQGQRYDIADDTQNFALTNVTRTRSISLAGGKKKKRGKKLV